MTRVAPKLLLAVLIGLVALPAAAHASPQQVLDECDSGLSRTYSNKDLRKALDNIPSDKDEYTDCRAVINAAIADGAGKSGDGDKNGTGGGGSGNDGGGGTGNAAEITGEEQAARQTDAEALAAIANDPDGDAIEVGGEEVRPGESGVFDVASAENGMPGPMIALLVALALAVVGGLLFLGRKRIPSVSFPSKRLSLPRGLSRLRR